MDMNTQNSSKLVSEENAHSIALDLMKQIITLSSGLLGVSATFVEKTALSTFLLVLLGLSWLSLILSIIFSLEAISAIVKSCLIPDIEWSSGAGQRSAAISKYSFIIGLALFVFFAFIGLMVSR
jgi:hypothetical protein